MTKLYFQFKLEQDAFKREFVLMNQTSRQNAKNNIENDFFKLMDNANFGFDCRSNPNNPKFEPIIDKTNEITYIKKYHNLYDSKVSKFLRSEILEQQINNAFEQKIAEVRQEDPFRNAHLREIEMRKMPMSMA